MPDNFLTGKIGPLPAWAWGAAGGGGFLLWYLRRQKASKAAADAAAANAAMTVPAHPGASPLLVSTGGEQLYNYSGSVNTSTGSIDSGNVTPPPPAPRPVPAWQFGFTMPRDPNKWIWQYTNKAPAGSRAATQMQGQAFPGVSDVGIINAGFVGAPGFPNDNPQLRLDSWQWAPVPPGMTASQYAALVNTPGSGGGGALQTIGGAGGMGSGAHRMGAMPRPSWVGSGVGQNLRHQSMSRARRPQRIG